MTRRLAHRAAARTPARIDTMIDLGDGSARLTARVNARARRLILRVDPIARIVHVTAPSRAALPEAIRFAGEKRGWIWRELARAAPARPFEIGGFCPYRGELHRIVAAPGGRGAVSLAPAPLRELRVGGREDHVNRRVIDWLKREARRILTEEVNRFAAALGRRPSRIVIRDTRSRWGSCAADGALSFSWRLILAPPEILSYVAAHECAHLLHADHSPRFWRTVAGLGVDARAARAWFRVHGETLHAWGAKVVHPGTD
jgi:predicted metal-dependent hydrolase